MIYLKPYPKQNENLSPHVLFGRERLGWLRGKSHRYYHTIAMVESEEQHLDHVRDIESMRFQQLYWQETCIRLQCLNERLYVACENAMKLNWTLRKYNKPLWNVDHPSNLPNSNMKRLPIEMNDYE